MGLDKINKNENGPENISVQLVQGLRVYWVSWFSDPRAKKERMGSNVNEGFRAEEAVAGNSEALRALRQLIIYPIIYAEESQKLGLRVICFLFFYFFQIQDAGNQGGLVVCTFLKIKPEELFCSGQGVCCSMVHLVLAR